MECSPPSRCLLRAYKNVVGWSASHRLSGGRGHSVFGDQGTYLVPRKPVWGNQIECSDSHQNTHLIEDVDKSQSVFALQRQRRVHIFLRYQHLGQSVRELSGSDVKCHELGEEGVLEF